MRWWWEDVKMALGSLKGRVMDVDPYLEGVRKMSQDDKKRGV